MQFRPSTWPQGSRTGASAFSAAVLPKDSMQLWQLGSCGTSCGLRSGRCFTNVVPAGVGGGASSRSRRGFSVGSAGGGPEVEGSGRVASEGVEVAVEFSPGGREGLELDVQLVDGAVDFGHLQAVEGAACFKLHSHLLDLAI